MENIGVNYPITLGKTGYFNPTTTTVEEARSNLIHLLLTNKGERIMQPNFGSEIYSLLFENIALDLPQVLTSSIKNTIKTWLPYIFVNKVEVNASPENLDNNMLEIGITYAVSPNLEDFYTINLEFNF